MPALYRYVYVKQGRQDMATASRPATQKELRAFADMAGGDKAVHGVLKGTMKIIVTAYTTEGFLLHSGEFTLNKNTSAVTVAGKLCELTRHEFVALWVLLSHKGEVATRDTFHDHLYGATPYTPGLRTVDVHVSALRGKLKAIGWDGRILSRRGVGYILVDPSDEGSRGES